MFKILAFLTLLVGVKHDYHVVVCEINQQKDKLQITQKIFIDDLEKTIEKTQSVKLLLGNVHQNPKAKEIIGNYILKHFQLKVSRKTLPINYLGYEIENDQIFAYLEAKSPTKIKELEINFPMLTELFSDQSNLVHLTIQGKKQSLYLNGSSPKEIVTFK